jgi:hypothetical protein
MCIRQVSHARSTGYCKDSRITVDICLGSSSEQFLTWDQGNGGPDAMYWNSEASPRSWFDMIIRLWRIKSGMTIISRALLITNLLLLKLKRPVFIYLETAFWCEVQALLIPFIAIRIQSEFEFSIILWINTIRFGPCLIEILASANDWFWQFLPGCYEQSRDPLLCHKVCWVEIKHSLFNSFLCFKTTAARPPSG